MFVFVMLTGRRNPRAERRETAAGGARGGRGGAREGDVLLSGRAFSRARARGTRRPPAARVAPERERRGRRSGRGRGRGGGSGGIVSLRGTRGARRDHQPVVRLRESREDAVPVRLLRRRFVAAHLLLSRSERGRRGEAGDPDARERHRDARRGSVRLSARARVKPGGTHRDPPTRPRPHRTHAATTLRTATRHTRAEAKYYRGGRTISPSPVLSASSCDCTRRGCAGTHTSLALWRATRASSFRFSIGRCLAKTRARSRTLRIGRPVAGAGTARHHAQCVFANARTGTRNPTFSPGASESAGEAPASARASAPRAPRDLPRRIAKRARPTIAKRARSSPGLVP